MIENDWREAIEAIKSAKDDEHEAMFRRIAAIHAGYRRFAHWLLAIAVAVLVVVVAGLAALGYQQHRLHRVVVDQQENREEAIRVSCEQTRGPMGTNGQLVRFVGRIAPKLRVSVALAFPVEEDCAGYAARLVESK